MPDVTLDQAIQIVRQYRAQGRLPEAEGICRQILSALPTHDPALYQLGLIAQQVGKLDIAIDFVRQAISASPNVSGYHADLGVFLQMAGQLDAAIECYRRALSLDPQNPDVQYNLADAWRRKGDLDAAIDGYRKSIQLQPNFFEAWSNLGDVLSKAGQMDQAIACFEKAIALKPDAIAAHNNLLYSLAFQPECDAAHLLSEFKRWNAAHAQPLKKFVLPHHNAREAGRRLRIGYVSPDFWIHPVGRFMLPLLQSHDRHGFEIFCYAHVAQPDAMTDRLQSTCENWRDILKLSDEEAASMIRADGIDILVDLAMHTSQNRNRLFARKPAPVQVAYLAYPGGSGLDTIDYRLTDRYLDPDPATDSNFLQKSIRLDGSYWCYQQTFNTPEVNQLPAIKNSYITFGCLNNFIKITQPVLETWAKLMAQIPGSRLLLHALSGRHRDGVINCLKQQNLSADRLETVGYVSPEAYFQHYHRIDIALDPFPYAGGTTTCDALWMGVPMVTLAGRNAVGRSGVSILNNIGLPELVAQSPEEYIQIANSLAANLPGLSQLRNGLRSKMQGSSLMDAVGYARSIEKAYRIMWEQWVEHAIMR